MVVAALTLRYGVRVRDAVRVAEHAEGQRRALGLEALDVLLSRTEAAIALPLVRRDARFSGGHSVETRDADAWLADLVDDPEDAWRSEWLAVCARHASRR
jgi:hypothetical protein